MASNDPNPTLEQMLAGIDAGLTARREIRKEYDARLAFNFDVGSFFRFGETDVSGIIAFLLDPTKPHSQKQAFLRLFLDHFRVLEKVLAAVGGSPDALPVQSVRCEYLTRGGRKIDVVIIFGDERKPLFLLGIENKIDAGDQQNQLDDYAKDLEAKVGDRRRYTLLYLTRGGDEPSEHSICPERCIDLTNAHCLKCIAYGGERGLIALLSKFEAACFADNVRSFIRVFQEYLQGKINGGSLMPEEKDYIANVLAKSPALAFDIIDSAPAFRSWVWNDMLAALKKVAAKSEFEVTNANEGYLMLRPQKWGRGGIDFSKWASGIWATLYVKEPGFSAAMVKDIGKATGMKIEGGELKKLLGEYPGNWDLDSNAWRDMLPRQSDGCRQFLDRIVGEFRAIRDATEQAANAVGYDLASK